MDSILRYLPLPCKRRGKSTASRSQISRVICLHTIGSKTMLGMIVMVGGAFFTVPVILAIAGIPLAFFGLVLLEFRKKNIAAVEEGYAEYLGTVQANSATA